MVDGFLVKFPTSTIRFSTEISTTSIHRYLPIHPNTTFDFNSSFPQAEETEQILKNIFELITHDLSAIQGSYMTKPFALHALCCAIYHNEIGLKDFQQKSGIAPIGRALNCSPERASSNLLELAAAHESKDTSRFPTYVEAMSAGSNREKQRTDRIIALCRALRDEL